MCIAIFKPAGVDIPIAHLSQGWICNPDGGGYGFNVDGKAVIRKGYMKLKDFLASYNADVAAHPESNFLVHFRIRSMGAKGQENTHPYQIEKGILIHNGTLTGTGARGSDGPSDTQLFADRFSKNLDFDLIQNNKEKWNQALSSSNKIAILYDDGRYQILNEGSGVWQDGVWYSNRSFVSWSGQNNGYYMGGYNEEEWE